MSKPSSFFRGPFRVTVAAHGSGRTYVRSVSSSGNLTLTTNAKLALEFATEPEAHPTLEAARKRGYLATIRKVPYHTKGTA